MRDLKDLQDYLARTDKRVVKREWDTIELNNSEVLQVKFDMLWIAYKK